MKSKLEKYYKKRNFEKTPEPKGEIINIKKNKEKKLKFFVQHHIASHDHFDFRLEWKGVLLSWAIPKGPSFNPFEKRLAIKVEDHPLDYGDFEGIIPIGQYGGGTVMLWDVGTYQPLLNFEEALIKGDLKFVLNGERLKGKWNLIKTKPFSKQESFLLIKEKDEFSKNETGIEKFTTSIKSGKKMNQITNDMG